MDPESEFTEIWNAALAAIDPLKAVPSFLPPKPAGRMVVASAGKAAARMALATERYYKAPLEGLAVTMFEHAEKLGSLSLIEAGHPVPDENGLAASEEILNLAKTLGRDDLLLVLLSGGASSLLTAPAVPLADKQAVTRALLASGAAIDEINAVRKHLSRIKGGRLAAAAYPARTVTLAISDVPGDDPAVIGSGPTVGDPTTLADARSILNRYNIDVPQSVRTALSDRGNESIDPSDERLTRSDYHVVARPADAISAGRDAAESLGYKVIDLGDRVEGEAHKVAKDHAALVRGELASGERAAIISGGELSVTGASGKTRGGRCREYLLALAIELEGENTVAAFAADTDGIDGSKDAAGAYVEPGSIANARAKGFDPKAYLDAHRSGEFFEAVETQWITGPTRTNVGDLRVILVRP